MKEATHAIKFKLIKIEDDNSDIAAKKVDKTVEIIIKDTSFSVDLDMEISESDLYKLNVIFTNRYILVQISNNIKLINLNIYNVYNVTNNKLSLELRSIIDSIEYLNYNNYNDYLVFRYYGMALGYLRQKYGDDVIGLYITERGKIKPLTTDGTIEYKFCLAKCRQPEVLKTSNELIYYI